VGPRDRVLERPFTLAALENESGVYKLREVFEWRP
jgi:hypothetical protein